MFYESIAKLGLHKNIHLEMQKSVLLDTVPYSEKILMSLSFWQLCPGNGNRRKEKNEPILFHKGCNWCDHMRIIWVNYFFLINYSISCLCINWNPLCPRVHTNICVCVRVCACACGRARSRVERSSNNSKSTLITDWLLKKIRMSMPV